MQQIEQTYNDITLEIHTQTHTHRAVLGVGKQQTLVYVRSGFRAPIVRRVSVSACSKWYKNKPANETKQKVTLVLVRGGESYDAEINIKNASRLIVKSVAFSDKQNDIQTRAGIVQP